MKRLTNILAMLLVLLMSTTTALANAVSIPQTMGQYINWNNATLSNCNVENDGKNIGSTHNGSTATFALSNTIKQEYFMTMKTGANNLTAELTITVMQGSNPVFTTERTVENTGSWTPTSLHNFSLGELPTGDLTLEIKVKSTTASYAGNYGDLAIYAASQYDKIPSTTNLNLQAGAHNGARYESANDNIGYITNNTSSIYTVYNSENAYVNMKMDIIGFYNSGQVKVTINDAMTNAKEAEQTFDITAGGNEQVFEIAEPLMKGLKAIRLDYTNTAGGFIMNYSHLQFNKRADYEPSAILTLKNISVDGVSLSDEAVKALKEDGGEYTLTGNIYTSVPNVAATLSNLSPAAVTSTIEGGNAVYTIKGTNYQTKFTIEGLHIFTPAATDKTVQLKYTSDGKEGNGNWSNGLYSLLSSSLDGWSGSSFKLNSTSNTITLPSNIKVKQFIFKDLGSNYASSAPSAITSFSAGDDAVIYLPTKHNYNTLADGKYDLIINIENHKAGAPISFTIEGGGQPTAWFELVTEETSDGNPIVTAQTATIVDNHAVITLNFDRAVKSATTTFNNKTYTAEGGSTTLNFQLWDLDFDTPYTFSISKSAIKDNYDNTAKEDVNVTFTTASKPAVTKAAYNYVVSNAAELDAAIAELAVSNNTATAARKTVFLKNGNYTYGTLVGSYQHNVSLKIDNWNSIHNVSLIGESKDGVIIEGITDGVTSSTIDLGDGMGNYLQDLTIRNNYDFRAPVLKGVSVAVTGGNKTVLKNVAMQASQDTYVTGKRTYLEDCDIYGTTDFICGGGDIFFERCNLILGNKAGAVISAPSTGVDIKWGYVFQNCVVSADEGATNVTDKNWNLGRPWQNEPRAYYLNTKYNVLPSDAGWTNMGSLPTHFYEYNSVDKNDNVLDLSVRQNSPTSTNKYTPVLKDEEAAQFTLRNVLGGTDSWDAIDETKQTAAPVITIASGKLIWQNDEDAMLYAIFKDGAFLTSITANEYTPNANGTYTVKAANKNGGLGAESNTVNYNSETNVVVAQGTETTSSTVKKTIVDGRLIITTPDAAYTAAGATVK